MPAMAKNDLRKQLLGGRDLRCRPVSLSSERFSTRATHIQRTVPMCQPIAGVMPATTRTRSYLINAGIAVFEGA
jgi:hypothetical protein